jgi:hypothetical protein
MIELLNQGLSVATLLDLISWRLEETRTLIACSFLGLDRVDEPFCFSSTGVEFTHGR